MSEEKPKFEVRKATKEDLKYISEHKEDFVMLAGSWEGEEDE